MEDERPAIQALMRAGPIKFVNDMTLQFHAEDEDIELRLFEMFSNLTQELTYCAEETEAEVSRLQYLVRNADSHLQDELDDHQKKVDYISETIDKTVSNFKKASDSAVRIGERLSTSENERKRLVKAIELVKCIKSFESTEPSVFIEAVGLNNDELMEILPEQLRDKDWGSISDLLMALRKILSDANSDQVNNARVNVLKISEVVEANLLAEFDELFEDLLTDLRNAELIGQCKHLSEWLHTFGGGQQLQKRFIFAVINKTMPIVSSRSGSMSSGAGAADDHLSALFGTISQMCRDHFLLIRQIFPVQFVARVTRLLIQRMFHDPAFGIQTRVELILSSKQQQQPSKGIANVSAQLSASQDYLDALCNVREKLSGLFTILMEHCVHPALLGLGAESATEIYQLKDGAMSSAQIHSYFASQRRGSNTSAVDSIAGRDRLASQGSLADENNSLRTGEEGSLHSGAGPVALMPNDEFRMLEMQKSESEIKRFLEDQINQVLAMHLRDYFDRELRHIEQQLDSLLRAAFDDPNSITKVSLLNPIPKLRGEKLKSVSSIVKSVGNNKFMSLLLQLSTDSCIRMESIGSGDKRLPEYLKTLYVTIVHFFVDSVYLPALQATTSLLMKLLTSKQSFTTSSSPELAQPYPAEALAVVSAVLAGAVKLKQHLTSDFIFRGLNQSPNLILICKEARRTAAKSLQRASKEVFHAWSMGVSAHVDRLLQQLQSKYDYCPRSEALFASNQTSGNSTSSSQACSMVSKSILSALFMVRNAEGDMVGINIRDEVYRPLGRLIVGNIMAHVKRQKISVEGGHVLLKDLDEYLNVLKSLEESDITDLMLCLKEIAVIYTTPADGLHKVVVETLRHLDTTTILVLLRSRTDFGSKAGGEWTRVLSATYPSIKWDSSVMFPWENRKLLTINAFMAAVHSDGAPNSHALLLLGPTSLRKTAMSTAYIASIQAAPIMSGSNPTATGKNFMLPQYNAGDKGGANSVALSFASSFMSGMSGEEAASNIVTSIAAGIKRGTSNVSAGVSIANNAAVLGAASKRRSSVVALAASANAANKAAKVRSLEQSQIVIDDEVDIGVTTSKHPLPSAEHEHRQSSTGVFSTSLSSTGIRDSLMKSFSSASIGTTLTSGSGTSNSAATAAGIPQPSTGTNTGSTWSKLSSIVKTTNMFKGK